MSTFTLKLVACNRVFYEGEAESLVFQVEDGEMAILANHQPMTTLVDVGEVRIRTADGRTLNAVVSDGMLKVEKNHVDMVVYTAETPEEIDAARAREAADRAKEELRQKQSIVEYHLSTASLARAMARLREVDKYMR